MCYGEHPNKCKGSLQAPQQAASQTEGNGRNPAGKSALSTATAAADDDDADSSTLFIKNLAWKTGMRIRCKLHAQANLLHRTP